MLAVSSYYAQLKAVRISDRTKAGLARAHVAGKVMGRPDGFKRWRAGLEAMREKGHGKKRMGRESRLSLNTLKSYSRRMDADRDGALAVEIVEELEGTYTARTS